MAYSSPLRAEQAAQTRASVIEAATTLFCERGWAGTSVRDVARTAGVSVETVYSSVGSKGELLKVAMDVAVVGDDEPVPLADRPEFRALGEGPRRQRREAAGRFLAALHPRTARLRRVLAAAAPGDPALAELEKQSSATERESVRQGLTAAIERRATERELDAAFTVLGPEVYLRLTDECGWSGEDYAAWVATTVRDLFDPKEEES